MMEGKDVFDPIDRTVDQYILPVALAQYIGLLGPPPLDMLRRSALMLKYFDKNGKLTHLRAFVHYD